ncbi:MAG: L,D-transpeptidase family protein [Verrucomicrobiales bacterium]
MKFPFIHLLPALLPLTFASCFFDGITHEKEYLSFYEPQQDQRASTDPGAALPDDISYWAGDGVTGSPKITINLTQQKAFFYKGDKLVGVSRISTGKEGNDTPSGSYKITQKSKNHRSNLYGIIRNKTTGETVNDDADSRVDKVPPGCEFVGAPMWNFMRFTGGIGMHTGYLPGYSASHGCVRMPDKMAKKFFEHCKIGTPVIVER